MGISTAVLEDWYRRMLLIRAFEDRVQELFMEGLVPGTTHLCQGQEAVCVGAVEALGPQDKLTVTYRGHGQALARGVDVVAAFAELMGRRSGLCRGLGGSMHFADADLGLLGAFAIVGAGVPVALGAAMSAQLRDDDAVAMTFFGDGASNIGTFHECLNMAAVWKAPIVFVCENNLYGEYSPMHVTTPVEDIAERAAAYAMPGEVVDGMDVVAVHEAATRAVQRARAGDGPTLLEMKTYRFAGHSRTDPAKYRPAGELEAWKARDPLRLLEARLTESGRSTDWLAAVRAETRAQIDEASRTAAAAEQASLQEAYDSVLVG